MSSPSALPPSGSPAPILDPALEAHLTDIINKAMTPVLTDLINSSPQPGRCRQKKRQRPTDGEENNASSSELEYYEYGRYYARQGDFFLKIEQCVTVGIVYETRSESEDSEDELLPSDKRCLEAWNILCKLIPDFKTNMLSLSARPKERKRICSEIMGGVNKVRADDTNSIKERIITYMMLGAPTATVSPPLIANSKANRGWINPETARLNSPLKYEATQETYDMIQHGKLLVDAGMYPRFLFPDDQIYDKDRVDNNIFRGHIMARACRHIFQGPSTALQKPGTRRGSSGNAAIAGLTAMTPRMIAYVAVQVRFALSSATSWDPVDGMFKYSDFFWNLVQVFDDEEEGPKLLAYFNQEVFGAVNGLINVEAVMGSPGDEISDFDLAIQQRTKRRARLEAEAEAAQ